MMDPELSSEMVKLLVQELKVVRTQLREAKRGTSTPHSGPSNSLTNERAHALIAENDTLKADDTALQQRVARLHDELIQAPCIKSEEGLSIQLQHAEPMPHARGQLARLRAENEVLIREKEVTSRNEEKLQEKYRRSKAKIHEYNKILNELRDALSNCPQELEQSRRAMVSETDFRTLLKGLPYEPVEGQSQLSLIKPYFRDAITKLYKDAIGACEGLYFLDHREVIWSPSGIALGLIVKPTFQYNPKIPGGKWTKLEDNFDIGKRIDVCCLSSKSSKAYRYLGTYERVGDQGTPTLASESLTHLGHDKLDYASKRTTLFPDFVPPSQTQMIKNMYKQGVIKLECFVIRCVAFNQAFAEKLRDTCTSSAQGNMSGTTIIPIPLVASKNAKRKRDQKPTNHPTRNKKRYERSPIA